MIDNKIITINKNNIIIVNNNIYSFYSYNTFICSYIRNTGILELTNFWSYSQTTNKYFKEFINNYTSFNYKDKKSFIEEINKNKNINYTIILK